MKNDISPLNIFRIKQWSHIFQIVGIGRAFDTWFNLHTSYKSVHFFISYHSYLKHLILGGIPTCSLSCEFILVPLVLCISYFWITFKNLYILFCVFECFACSLYVCSSCAYLLCKEVRRRDHFFGQFLVVWRHYFLMFLLYYRVYLPM